MERRYFVCKGKTFLITIFSGRHYTKYYIKKKKRLILKWKEKLVSIYRGKHLQ